MQRLELVGLVANCFAPQPSGEISFNTTAKEHSYAVTKTCWPNLFQYILNAYQSARRSSPTTKIGLEIFDNQYRRQFEDNGKGIEPHMLTDLLHTSVQKIRMGLGLA